MIAGTPEILVDARGLEVHLPIDGPRGREYLKAVDGINLTIGRGEILSVVGESGCGKSTTGRALVRLVRPTSGVITFAGSDITGLSQRELRPIRGRLQMIFQHPGAALNPRLTIAQSIAEPLTATGVNREARRIRIDEMLEKVGLSASKGKNYPHELSGGQLQRVAIARALVGCPEFIVADEPLSSLDLSIQAQILALLVQLQEETSISLLFITHDLSAAEYIADRIAVMYLGKLVEVAPARRFSRRAKHPYSQALLNAVPRLDPETERRRQVPVLAGEVPSPLNPPRGCRFCTRCPLVEERCRQTEPPMRKDAEGHELACWVV